MQNTELLIILLLGTALMCIPISIQMKWYSVKRWKSIPVSVILVLTGVVGSYLWYFIENFAFGGRSFFGAVFFAPLVFLPVAKCLQIPYGYMMDFVAPAGCLTLALVKIQCLRDGCCQGMVLHVNEDNLYVRFPSQIVEMIVFLILSAILMHISADPNKRKTVFPWFLILYGATRFGLDFLRDSSTSYALGLSAGSFWSLWAFGIGLVALLVLCKKNQRVCDKAITSKESVSVEAVAEDV